MEYKVGGDMLIAITTLFYSRGWQSAGKLIKCSGPPNPRLEIIESRYLGFNLIGEPRIVQYTIWWINLLNSLWARKESDPFPLKNLSY